MTAKKLLPILGLVLALAVGLALAAGADVEKPAACVNKKLCAEKLRFGVEAYNRGRYIEAKAYFRQAVQADPNNIRAWSYYDLSIMYDLAEQVKRTGRVTVSSAPNPASTPDLGRVQTQAPAPAPPAPPAPTTGGGIVIDDEGC